MSDDKGMARPADQALVSDQAPAGLAPAGFDPSRVAKAVALVEESKLMPIVRKAADEFYNQLYTEVEDYLKENLNYNITQHIAMLERENRRMTRELYEINEIVGAPWFSHEKMIERLRDMDKDVRELSALKYKLAFGDAIETETRRAETLGSVEDDGSDLQASPNPSRSPSQGSQQG